MVKKTQRDQMQLVQGLGSFSIMLFLYFILALVSCKKDTTEVCPSQVEEVFYRAEFMPVTTVDNDCGLVLAIDTNNNGVTDIGGHAVNLDSSYNAYDTLWIQYNLLPDSFYCHIYGGIVGGDYDPVFPSIEITKIKE